MNYLMSVQKQTSFFVDAREKSTNLSFRVRGDNQNDNASLLVRIKYRFKSRTSHPVNDMDK